MKPSDYNDFLISSYQWCLFLTCLNIPWCRAITCLFLVLQIETSVVYWRFFKGESLPPPLALSPLRCTIPLAGWYWYDQSLCLLGVMLITTWFYLRQYYIVYTRYHVNIEEVSMTESSDWVGIPWPIIVAIVGVRPSMAPGLAFMLAHSRIEWTLRW